jgi:hypothetical protein
MKTWPVMLAATIWFPSAESATDCQKSLGAPVRCQLCADAGAEGWSKISVNSAASVEYLGYIDHLAFWFVNDWLWNFNAPDLLSSLG